jgi:hypothetical protein
VIEKLFPVASRIVEAVMERGARTHQGEDWRALPSEPHLAHAACRLLMELEGIDHETETKKPPDAANAR